MEIDQMAAIDNATSEELELMLNAPTPEGDAPEAETPTEAPAPETPDTAEAKAEPTPTKLQELEEQQRHHAHGGLLEKRAHGAGCRQQAGQRDGGHEGKGEVVGQQTGTGHGVRGAVEKACCSAASLPAQA